MIIQLRRFVVVAALMFWQGGFTFYAAVVVPIGQAKLGHQEQGFITREVTHCLNLTGLVALVLLAWDSAETRDPNRGRIWARWFSWTVMLGTLGALVLLHPHLDRLLNLDTRELIDRNAFRPRHRLYLWLSTVQWGCAVAYAYLAIQAWRAEDRAASA